MRPVHGSTLSLAIDHIHVRVRDPGCLGGHRVAALSAPTLILDRRSMMDDRRVAALAPGWSLGRPRDPRISCVAGPCGSNPVRNLVTRDPPSSRFSRQKAGTGPLVTRTHAEMVPREPSSSTTWSPGNHLPRCPWAAGPQRTRLCGQMVPGGTTLFEMWILKTQPPRASPGEKPTLILW